MNICVYCASSNRVAGPFRDAADELGRLIAQNGHTLVYGGGNVGLMGVLARSVHQHEGAVVGVIPEALQQIEGRAYDIADELIVTRTMQERKRIMFTRADAFVVLPGGIGTMEEFMEVLTLKHLGYHAKPITLVNVDAYFGPLIAMLEHACAHNLSPRDIHAQYDVVGTAAATMKSVVAHDVAEGHT